MNNIEELNKMNKAAGLPQIKIERKLVKSVQADGLAPQQNYPFAEPEPKPKRKRVNKKKTEEAPEAKKEDKPANLDEVKKQIEKL